MNRKKIFFICFLLISVLVSGMVSGRMSMAQADSLTAATSSGSTVNSATETKTINFRVVCEYNRNIPISNLDISLIKTNDGEIISGKTDAQGNVAFSGMEAGTYNAYLTDTYGNSVSTDASITVTTNETVPVVLPMPLARLQIIYRNVSSKDYQAPSYGVSGTFGKTYQLNSIALGESLTSDAGYVANGASYLVSVKSEKGIMVQKYFLIPAKTGAFGISIYDRNLSIFMR